MTTFEPGASEVLTHGLDFRPFSHRVAREQAGAEHDRRVRGVRARGDRGDHDVAVVELGLRAVLERHRHGDLGALGDLQAAGAAVGRLRLRCAARRAPLWSPEDGGSEDGNESALASSGSALALLRVLDVVGQQVLEREPERRLGLGQRDAVLRALRAGERRHDLREVELERVGVRRLLGVVVVPQALLLGVRLDELERAPSARPENSR